MDYPQGNDARPRLVQASGRRQSLQSLMAAGMALLATVGLGMRGEGKNRHGAHHDRRHNTGNAHSAGKGKGKGKAGPTGPTGPTGPAGSGGGGGEISIVMGTSVTWDNPGNTFVSQELRCPDGTQAIGATYDLSHFNCHLTMETRFSPTIWIIDTFCASGSASYGNSAAAVCLSLV